ncbi:serine/threonine-protein kinase LMTK1 [Synchiropus picturatus]
MKMRTNMEMKILLLLLLLLVLMMIGPGFALNSHFNSDGAHLSDLSWSSSLAVVAVSLAGLFSLVFLTLACICCKRKQRRGFKEFRNVDDFHADVSSSPVSLGGPDVYILPLTEVSLPVAKQPTRSVELTKSSDVTRHDLLYLKEIGSGWFGKVLLAEVNQGLRTSQVVVKELKSSASILDQIHFLEEAQPFRVLQHSSLLRCLSQCTDVTPYLLVMEFCPLGDVKGYLRSCRSADTLTPEPLVLQRMACDIAAGLLHLHQHNFTLSDLALRNCLLTADVTVKIGDYGLSRTKYKDDYMMMSDQTLIPLRWTAPELLDEMHGNLLVGSQTQQSNIWTLGVTIWELFELGNQPYRHYSDRQVLTYAVRDQQLRLPKPLLKVPLAERWYEVMQFCWLQPDQRPTAEEVHLLLSYLCAKGASEAEEDFESRWNSMCPNPGHSSHCVASVTSLDQHSTNSSSFPLLEQFSGTEGYHSESGDDVLTITETSHGLNFEYKWEQAKAEQSFGSPVSSNTLGQVDHHCQEAFYPPGGIVGGCPTHGVSPSYYQTNHLHAPGVLPVLSAHSPSVSSEYYIRIEETVDSNIDPDYTMCTYSPDLQDSSGSFLTGSADSGECIAKNIAPYWAADVHKSELYDSNDSSPAISLTMEPLLGQGTDSSPLRPWESSHYVSYKDRDGGYYYEHSSPTQMDRYSLREQLFSQHRHESWGSRSLRRALGELDNPLGRSPTASSPPQQGYRETYLDTGQTSIIGNHMTGGYYDMMGSLRKTMPSHTVHDSTSVNISMETEGPLFIARRESDTEDEDVDIFVERQNCNTWPSKHRYGNASHHRRASHSCRQDAYVDFNYTMPSTDIEDSWPEKHSFHTLPKTFDYLETHQVSDNSACLGLTKHHPLVPADNCNTYIYLCQDAETQVPTSGECYHSNFMEPLTGLLVQNSSYGYNFSPQDYMRDKATDTQGCEEMLNLSPAPGGPIVAKPVKIWPETSGEQYVDLMINESPFKEKKTNKVKDNLILQSCAEPKAEDFRMTQYNTAPPPSDNMHVMVAHTDSQSEVSHMVDSGMDPGDSTISLVDILDCSDDDEDDEDITDDITDVTSGIFADESSEATASSAFKSLQKQVGTPDSVDSIDLPSTAAFCDGLSPASQPSCSPKAMDSGYDTENHESPEFVPKEPHESRDQSPGKLILDISLKVEEQLNAEETPTKEENVSLKTSQSCESVLQPLSEQTPHRDSAYFSDQENERVRDESAQVPETTIEEDEDEDRHSTDEDGIKEHTGQGCRATESGLPLEPTLSVDALDEWPSQEENSSLGDWAAEVVGAMEEALGALNVDPAIQEPEDLENPGEPTAQENPNLSESKPEICNTFPKDEVALQHMCGTHRFSSSSPPPQSPPAVKNHSTERRLSHSDGDEDEETDDSDESDEELRSYSLQEPSECEESEEESYPVPIVVSDNSEAHQLRSLLKIPTLLNMENLEDGLEPRTLKTVSFFDDVTMYLFDQESPTKELVEHKFLLGTEHESAQSKVQVKANTSDDSSDGNISEESAGYEWEDDFSLLPLPTSSDFSPPHRSTSRNQDPKPAERFSRFTVSPSSVSRFSITQITDADCVDGSSEDGDKN